MATIPGYTVTIGDKPAATVSAADTGTCFMVGFFERGSVTAPIHVTSPAELVEKTGDRLTGTPTDYDAAEAFFREGGSSLYIGRVNAAEAATAKKEAVDSESKKDILVSAKSPGSWGNNIKAAITKTSSTFVIVVKYNGTTVETSPTFSTVEEAVVWSQNESKYVTITAEVESTAIPKTQEITLAGGTYAVGSATEAQVKAALALFDRDLGPGQVIAPSQTSEAMHKELAAHALANNRRAILDDENTGTAATLASHATALRSLTGNAQRFATMVAPYVKIPGLSVGTTRTIPPSAVYAALIARNEGEGRNPNDAAAGKVKGRCTYVIECVSTFSAESLQTLNEAGVIAIKPVEGVPCVFGNRTLTNPVTDSNWKSFSASRLVMGVAALAGEILANYEFAQIDGHGYIFKELAGDLSGGACMPFYKQNALYGQTPEDAFVVNTGPDVNTPGTIAAEEIKAQIALRVSPTGERLSVEIVKIPIVESIL